MNKYFPKGDKRRRDALVINAIALLEGFKQGRESELNRIKGMINQMIENAQQETNLTDPIEWLTQLRKEI